MTEASERPFYTVAEAARLLAVNPSTVWRWIAAGRLPAHRVGQKALRIKREDVAALSRPATRRARSGATAEPVQELARFPTLEQAKTLIHQPPTDEEFARRRAVVAMILENRKGRTIAPLTSADLVHEARSRQRKLYDPSHSGRRGGRVSGGEVASD